MKRLVLLLPLISLLCAADAPVREPKKLQIWVSVVIYNVPGRSGSGLEIYSHVGETEAVAIGKVMKQLKDAQPNGFSIINLKTMPVPENMVDQIVENRRQIEAQKK